MKKFNFFKTKQQNRRNAMIGAMSARPKEDMPKGAFGHNFMKVENKKNKETGKVEKVKVLVKKKYKSFNWKDDLEKGQKTWKPKKEDKDNEK